MMPLTRYLPKMTSEIREVPLMDSHRYVAVIRSLQRLANIMFWENILWIF